MTAFAAGVCLLAVGGVALACLAPWTRTVTLKGQLRPDLGLVRLVAPRDGQLLALAVRPGQVVHRGDVVARIVDDGRNGRSSPAHAEALAQMELRKQSLIGEMRQRELFSQAESASLDARRRRIEEETAFADEQIRLQVLHVGFAQGRVSLYADLVAKGFISDMGRQQRDEELIEQQMHLSELRAARTRLSASRESIDFEQRSAGDRSRRERESLLRDLASTTEAMARDQQVGEAVVVSPLDGVVGSIDAAVGQSVAINEGLATLLPEGAVIEAVCDVSIEEAASLRAGQAASVRIGVAPYREQGRVRAVVQAIADAPQPGSDKVVQRVRLHLESQTFVLDQRTFPLRPGATAVVEVALDRQPILAWLLPATRNTRAGVRH